MWIWLRFHYCEIFLMNLLVRPNKMFVGVGAHQKQGTILIQQLGNYQYYTSQLLCICIHLIIILSLGVSFNGHRFSLFSLKWISDFEWEKSLTNMSWNMPVQRRESIVIVLFVSQFSVKWLKIVADITFQIQAR